MNKREEKGVVANTITPNSNITRKRFSLIPAWYLSVITIATLMSVPIIFGRLHFFIDIFAHFQLQYTLVGISLLILGFFLGIHKSTLALLAAGIILHFVLLIYPISLLPFLYNSSDNTANPQILFMNSNYFNTDIEPLVEIFAQGNTDTVGVVEMNEQVHLILKAMYGKPASLIEDGTKSCAIFTNQQYETIDLSSSNFEYPVCAVMINDIVHLAIHPYPPLSADYFKSQASHFKEIREYLDEIESDGGIYILMGDFNSSYYSPVFRETFADIFTKNTYSWNLWKPNMMPIDHALSNMDIEIQRSVKSSSDHAGLFVWY